MNKVIANFHISLIYEDGSYTAYDITQRMKSDKYGKVTENVINEWENTVKTTLMQKDDTISHCGVECTSFFKLDK